MKHWKTNEEMGNGFIHTKKEHKDYGYNYLQRIAEHECNTMRTAYLIRDQWTLAQLKELKVTLDNEILEKEEKIQSEINFLHS